MKDGTTARARPDEHPGRALRRRLDSGRLLTLPGAANALTAKLVEETGFDAVYVTGAGVANTALGVPDIGLLTVTELASHVAAIVDAVGISVVADADTGFGNAINVRRTVQLLERAGAAAMQIEDQTFPKRCGHFADTSVIGVEEMCGKIRAAVDARSSDDFLIIARTDARATLGIEAAVERGRRYRDAGADVIFVESPVNLDEIKYIAGNTPGRLMINFVHGGNTPDLSLREVEELGFVAALYANLPLLASIHGVRAVLKRLHDGRTDFDGLVASWDERQQLVGKPEFDLLEQRYAADADEPGAGSAHDIRGRDAGLHPGSSLETAVEPAVAPAVTPAGALSAHPAAEPAAGPAPEPGPGRQQVTVVGAGAMGGAVARRLLALGHDVTVFDADTDAARRYADAGARIAPDLPAALADTDVVLTSLPNSAAVRDVWLGAAGLVRNAKPGTLLVELSTIDPDTMTEVSEAAVEANLRVVDCAVSGGPGEAISGELVLLIGTEEPEPDPLLRLFGRAEVVGPPGSGKVVKLINNLMTMGNVALAGEAFALGNRHGLDPARLFDVLSGSGGSSHQFVKRFPSALRGDYRPGFATELGLKDLTLGLELARQVGQEAPIAQTVRQVIQRIVDLGYGEEDIVSVLRLYRGELSDDER